MFTGIVTDIGTILATEDRGDLRARIACAYPAGSIDLGASIACDGVCLTVVDRGPEGNGAWFAVDVSAETLAKTNLGRGRIAWGPGRRVNLERALKAGRRTRRAYRVGPCRRRGGNAVRDRGNHRGSAQRPDVHPGRRRGPRERGRPRHPRADGDARRDQLHGHARPRPDLPRADPRARRGSSACR
jgi:hypothetical protein